jgi:hypothetical protein
LVRIFQVLRICQHATSERDSEIASAMDRRMAKQADRNRRSGAKACRRKKDDRPDE